MKTLDVSDANGARKAIPDLKVVGNGDTWLLLCKASSEKEGWMKSTKGLQTPYGVVLQVTTHQRSPSPNGSDAIAEAICFVPQVKIVSDGNGGRKLVGMFEDRVSLSPRATGVRESSEETDGPENPNPGEPAPVGEDAAAPAATDEAPAEEAKAEPAEPLTPATE